MVSTLVGGILARGDGGAEAGLAGEVARLTGAAAGRGTADAVGAEATRTLGAHAARGAWRLLADAARGAGEARLAIRVDGAARAAEAVRAIAHIRRAVGDARRDARARPVAEVRGVRAGAAAHARGGCADRGGGEELTGALAIAEACTPAGGRKLRGLTLVVWIGVIGDGVAEPDAARLIALLTGRAAGLIAAHAVGAEAARALAAHRARLALDLLALARDAGVVRHTFRRCGAGRATQAGGAIAGKRSAVLRAAVAAGARAVAEVGQRGGVGHAGRGLADRATREELAGALATTEAVLLAGGRGVGRALVIQILACRYGVAEAEAASLIALLADAEAVRVATHVVSAEAAGALGAHCAGDTTGLLADAPRALEVCLAVGAGRTRRATGAGVALVGRTLGDAVVDARAGAIAGVCVVGAVAVSRARGRNTDDAVGVALTRTRAVTGTIALAAADRIDRALVVGVVAREDGGAGAFEAGEVALLAEATARAVTADAIGAEAAGAFGAECACEAGRLFALIAGAGVAHDAVGGGAARCAASAIAGVAEIREAALCAVVDARARAIASIGARGDVAAAEGREAHGARRIEGTRASPGAQARALAARHRIQSALVVDVLACGHGVAEAEPRGLVALLAGAATTRFATYSVGTEGAGALAVRRAALSLGLLAR